MSRKLLINLNIIKMKRISITLLEIPTQNLVPKKQLNSSTSIEHPLMEFTELISMENITFLTALKLIVICLILTTFVVLVTV